MQLKQVPFNFFFRLLSDGLLFSIYFFGPRKKTTLDYSLWFLQNLDETMTAGYFLGGGESPLDCCLPPLQIGSNNSVLYFPKDTTPPRPPTTGSHANIIPPLQNIPRKYPVLLCFWVLLFSKLCWQNPPRPNEHTHKCSTHLTCLGC